MDRIYLVINVFLDISTSGLKLIKCYQCTGESPNCMETCYGKLCYRHEMEFGKGTLYTKISMIR
jgi:hypothetical protein